MSGIATAVVAGAVISGSMSSRAQKKAAAAAAGAQTESTEAGIAEQQRQFDAVRKLLEPYVNAGTGALTAQQNLVGLGGAEAQRSAIAQLQQSPQFQTLTQQGENAILANASATGGLRGGNTQGALAQFRPALLSQLIDQQYARLGGLTSLGQNAAAGTGNAGMQTGNSISQLLQQQGAAQAGNALAVGRANAAMGQTIGSAIGQIGGMYASGAFNSAPTTGVASGTPTNVVF